MTTQEQQCKLLKDIITARGIKQAELARQAGISAKHLNLILNNKANARSAMLDYLAWMLNVHFVVNIEDGKE